MKLYRRILDKIRPYIPGKPIEEVKREFGLDEVYKLASNEIPFAPTYIRKAVLAEINTINRYPESSSFSLRQAVARKHQVSADQIVFGNGSDEVITLALRAFVDKGDEVIIADPTFLVYEIQAIVQGARIVKVPLKDCQYDLPAMLKAITNKTKFMFISNPDNPTGAYINEQQIREFLRKVPKRVLVFFDEAYFEFAPKNFPKSRQFLEQRGNIIFSRTFSKAYGLAGIRIGYGVTSKEIAEALQKVREPFNINRFAQAAAEEALKQKKFLRKVITFVNKEKKYLYDELDKLGLEYIKSATNFILVKHKIAVTPLVEFLLRQGIVVRDLTGWGFPQFFRVSVGLHKENKRFIDKLKLYLKINN